MGGSAETGSRQMFDVFGAEMPLAARFVLAFLVVLGLIGATAWADADSAAADLATQPADASRVWR